MRELALYSLREDDFDHIIRLGEQVHGAGYLNRKGLEKMHRKSIDQGLSCSYVLYDGTRECAKLAGFRITYAPTKWEIDKWCSPKEWGIPPEKVCYFKSNTLAPEYRGRGLGQQLLNASIRTAQQLGALAGVTHIWMQSPGKSAFRYFARAGGKLIWVWPSRWNEESRTGGYICTNCGTDCRCDGAEMILYFGEKDE